MRQAYLQSRCSWAFVLGLALMAGPASAQLEIVSSPNPVGSGARALGMGGAFIAIADDATAASWNPGGLTQLERPELSLVYSWKSYGEDFTSQPHPELDGSHSVDISQINYASFVYPIPRTIGGRNLVLSLNYLQQYDFDRDLDLRFNNRGLANNIVVSNLSQIDYSQRGSLATLSPAFGFELTNTLSVGVVMNIWNQDILPDNEWKVRRTNRVNTLFNGTPFAFTELEVEEDYEEFEGINFTLGMLWKPNDRWSVGAVYHSKFTADVRYTQRQRLPILGGFIRARRDLEYVFPSAFGVGVSYRFPNDKLTLSMDVTRRNWDQFVIHDDQNPSLRMQRRSGVSGLPKDLSPHDPTYTVRLGAEYVFVNKKKPRQILMPSLRAGLFYDPEPASNRPNRWFGLGRGDGKVDDYYGAALGLGVLIKDRVNIDMAYIYRWGNDVRQDTFGLVNTDGDVDQHYLYLSTVIYF